MLRAILFDLDGTLANTEAQNAEAVARVLQKRGHAISDDERHFVIGHGWREIYDELVQKRRVDLSFAEVVALAAEEREKIVAASGLDVLPGVPATVLRLAARFPLGLVSGSSRREIEGCLSALGLRKQFRCVVAAEDVERGKPAPDGYLRAAEMLDLQPSECLVIEDSTAGIESARSAGMRCIAISAGNFAGQDQTRADLVLPTLLLLDDQIIDGMNG
jgi:HAD superfamily hydrolase (TIGR01509 family)